MILRFFSDIFQCTEILFFSSKSDCARNCMQMFFYSSAEIPSMFHGISSLNILCILSIIFNLWIKNWKNDEIKKKISKNCSENDCMVSVKAQTRIRVLWHSKYILIKWNTSTALAKWEMLYQQKMRNNTFSNESVLIEVTTWWTITMCHTVVQE